MLEIFVSPMIEVLKAYPGGLPGFFLSTVIVFVAPYLIFSFVVLRLMNLIKEIQDQTMRQQQVFFNELSTKREQYLSSLQHAQDGFDERLEKISNSYQKAVLEDRKLLNQLVEKINDVTSKVNLITTRFEEMFTSFKGFLQISGGKDEA